MDADEAVIRAAEEIIEATPAAVGQRLGRALATQLDSSLQAWLGVEARRAVLGLAALGVTDVGREVAVIIARVLRRYADELDGRT